MNYLYSVNPFNDKLIHQRTLDSKKEILEKVVVANKAHGSWKKTSIEERSRFLEESSSILVNKKEVLAILISEEMGKVISESRAEIDKCILLCRYYAENLEAFLKPDLVKNELNGISSINYESLGVILGVMPWNFPFWQVFRFAVPALASGNSVLLKHASNVSLSAEAIEAIFKEAYCELPIFQNLFIDNSSAEMLVGHPFIKAISLTGSEAAGKAVGSLGGKYLKKMVMELGSNDAFIVDSTANIPLAASEGARSRLINNGQSCIAAKRFILAKEIYDEFLFYFKEYFEKIKHGNPLMEDTQLGPLARKDLKINLQNQIDDSISKGAKLTVCLQNDFDDSAFFSPSILENVSINSSAYREELFGPVATFIKVDSMDEAIVIANDSLYGLGASVWSANNDNIHRMIKELNVGSVFINNIVYSHPSLPFGGINQSGYGRELSSFGIKEFVNIKSVFIKE
ncbi:MAG: NAD-dependent succinate-semialdehyde dehydrogenase [Cytophagales bacterium]|nr:MAG: NAD-dependent succinate-semialdehyde dehydrogenase [Cytophagales bacterium]